MPTTTSNVDGDGERRIIIIIMRSAEDLLNWQTTKPHTSSTPLRMTMVFHLYSVFTKVHEPVEIFQIPRAVSSTYYKRQWQKWQMPLSNFSTAYTTRWQCRYGSFFHPTTKSRRERENMKRQHHMWSYYNILNNSQILECVPLFRAYVLGLSIAFCMYGFQSIRIEIPSKMR